MAKVFITYSGDPRVEVNYMSDDVTLVLIDTDRLEDYTFMYRDHEVTIATVNQDGTVDLIDENLDKDYVDVPLEELDVIEGEEYLDV